MINYLLAVVACTIPLVKTCRDYTKYRQLHAFIQYVASYTAYMAYTLHDRAGMLASKYAYTNLYDDVEEEN